MVFTCTQCTLCKSTSSMSLPPFPAQAFLFPHRPSSTFMSFPSHMRDVKYEIIMRHPSFSDGLNLLLNTMISSSTQYSVSHIFLSFYDSRTAFYTYTHTHTLYQFIFWYTQLDWLQHLALVSSITRNMNVQVACRLSFFLVHPVVGQLYIWSFFFSVLEKHSCWFCSGCTDLQYYQLCMRILFPSIPASVCYFFVSLMIAIRSWDRISM